jgi:uncharacterized membrane protein YoaK (UPF0700 family)
MTGNTVLLAIAIARGDGTDALRSAVALAGFSIGVVIGALLIDQAGRWPAGAALALAVQALVMASLLVTWLLVSAPTGAIRYAMLGAAGTSMGLQSLATRAASTGPVATTYVTGTLTSALVSVARVIRRRSGQAADKAQTGELAGTVWLVYGAGALIGAVIELGWHAGGFVVPVAIVTLVAIGAHRVAVGHQPGSET